MDILKRFLIPRYIHSLQNPKITRDLLRFFDRNIRKEVRRWLHLTRTTSSAFLHAHPKDGGLGFFPFLTSILAILFSRFSRLDRSDPDVCALSCCQYFLSIQHRLSKLPSAESSPSQRKTFWGTSLGASYSGNGLIQGNTSPASSSWIGRPPPYWSGRDFCRAVQLRGNLLPNAGIPSNLSSCRTSSRAALPPTGPGSPATMAW